MPSIGNFKSTDQGHKFCANRVRRLSNRLGRRRNTIQTNITNHHPEISRIGLVRLLPQFLALRKQKEPSLLTIPLTGPGPPPPSGHGFAQPRPGTGGVQQPPSTPQHFGSGAPQGYEFRYSQCTGRRKALLIGINYFGQRGQLRGCINDVRNMTGYLAEHFGYKREDMVILTDDQQNPMSQPTKQNILRAMHWLVKDARPNDSLFFHYSGTVYSHHDC